MRSLPCWRTADCPTTISIDSQDLGTPGRPRQRAPRKVAREGEFRSGTRDVASLVVGKPRNRRDHDGVRENCYTADEARALLTAAKEVGPQFAAVAALALDSGARKGELCDLRWSGVDLDAGTVTFVRQLLKPGRDPIFGPTT